MEKISSHSIFHYITKRGKVKTTGFLKNNGSSNIKSHVIRKARVQNAKQKYVFKMAKT